MTAATFSLFSFAGIKATLEFTDYDACEGNVIAHGFDKGGEYAFANVAIFDRSFASPAGRDATIAKAMKFVAEEMLKQADWQAS